MKIYTKTGDAGETGLYSGERLSKGKAIFNLLGTLDELNAHIGLIRSVRGAPSLNTYAESEFRRIQNDLFALGADLGSTNPAREMLFDVASIELLEESIDSMESETPKLRAFILPAGSPLVCHIHVARAVARRAERALVATKIQGPDCYSSALRYLNRLSDYLFVHARFITHCMGQKETIWKPTK